MENYREDAESFQYVLAALWPSFLKKRRQVGCHSCIELSWPTYNVYVTKFRLPLSSNMMYDPAQ